MDFFNRHLNVHIRLQGVLHGLAAHAYIGCVIYLISSLAKFPEPDSLVVPMAFLSLFVASVAMMASIVFARPLFMFLEGRRKDAVSLLIWTVSTLVLGAIGWFLILVAALPR